MSKKRGSGEGSIFEESPGRWVATLSLGYHVGKDGKRRRVRKKFTASTRGQVQRKLTAALKEHQTGGVVPMQRDSLGRYLQRWLETLTMKGRSAATVASYRWLTTKHIEPEIGMIPLTKLTQVHLNDFMQRKLAAGLSARTVGYCHAVVRSALTKAEKDGLVGRNVAKLAEPPAQTGGSRVEPLTPDEARRFLAAVAGHRLEALYSVALAIGLRRGEALGLEWSGVDLNHGTVSVTQTVKRVKGQGLIVERRAKTEKSLRMLPLPDFAIRHLIAHKERQAQERLAAEERWQEHGLVFASTVGTPIEPRNLVRHFHATLEVAKIDRRRYHDLRHTAASLLIAQGATLHEVKDILGHSQIRLTADLYGHAYMAAKRSVVDKMGDILAPQLKPVAPSLAPLVEKSRPN